MNPLVVVQKNKNREIARDILVAFLGTTKFHTNEEKDSSYITEMFRKIVACVDEAFPPEDILEDVQQLSPHSVR